MSTEGSREIEAARKRLAAAKAYESSASTNVKKAISMMNNANSMMAVAECNMKTAQSMVATAAAAMKSAESMKKTSEGNIEDSQTQLRIIQEEVEDAENFLKEAEKRWEVVDVDAPTELQSDITSRKKRKVSLSPEADKNSTASDAPDNSKIACTATLSSLARSKNSSSPMLRDFATRLEKRLGHSVSSDSGSVGSDFNDLSPAIVKLSQAVYHEVQQSHTSTWSHILPSGFFKHQLKSKNTVIVPPGAAQSSIAAMRETFHQTGLLGDLKILPHVELNSILHVYTMEVTKYDVELFPFCGRHVVEDDNSWLITTPHPKPKAGAFIVAINDRLLPLGITPEEVEDYLYDIDGQNVAMTFVEDYDFMSMYTEDIAPKLPQIREEEMRNKQEMKIRDGKVVGLIRDDGVVEVDGKSIEGITVFSCGVAGANGKFNRSSLTHDDVPMYVKTGVWEGKEEQFWIFRRELSSKKTWHLLCGGKHSSGSGIQKPAAYLFSVDCSFYGRKSDPLYNIPPKTGWKLSRSSKGATPFPQLKWE